MGYGVNGLHGVNTLVIDRLVYNIDGAVVTIANNLWAFSTVLVNHLK